LWFQNNWQSVQTGWQHQNRQRRLLLLFRPWYFYRHHRRHQYLQFRGFRLRFRSLQRHRHQFRLFPQK
jgi:hypothetical protein